MKEIRLYIGDDIILSVRPIEARLYLDTLYRYVNKLPQDKYDEECCRMAADAFLRYLQKKYLLRIPGLRRNEN